MNATIAVAPSPRRTYATAWWGMATLVITESMVFVVLLSAYFFLRATTRAWPPAGIELPELPLSILFSVVLWSSSAPIFLAEAAMRAGRIRRAQWALALSFVMGFSFLVYTLHDFDGLHFGWRDSAYASIFYTIVGLHAIHVAIGLAMSVVVQLKARIGRYDAEHHASAQAFFLYWHFIDAVWVFVFGSVILGPRL